MSEKPILFSGPMVTAILDGRKTQTRRVIPIIWRTKPPLIGISDVIYRISKKVERNLGEWDVMNIVGSTQRLIVKLLPICPYGKPGDRLWVRETWATTINVERDAEWPCRPFVAPEWDDDENPQVMMAATIFAADGHWPWTDGDGSSLERKDGSEGSCWTPSIFMPRWASRITLEVSNVRVSRLRDISNEDAKAEGVEASESVERNGGSPDYTQPFQDAWLAMHGSDNSKSWEANPWVWIIEFRKLETNS